MDTEELIFVTGATGFLGERLVRELLARNPKSRLALLIRERTDRSIPYSAKSSIKAASQSSQQRADLIVSPVDRARVQVIAGDVNQDNCGIDRKTWQQLA